MIAAAPWMRRGWKLLPAPLKVPVVLGLAAYGIYKLVSETGDSAQPA